MKLPVLFLGHGNPMNAIEHTVYSESWQRLGKALRAQYGGKIRAILAVSAHWVTRGSAVTAMEKPRTIHDFGGFPQALFDAQYPAPGSPEVAAEIRALLGEAEVAADLGWGLDHGTWSVVKHLYPEANVPVIQLSIDYTKSPQYHFELAKKLSDLRRKGILIIGSGNIVHNLRLVDFPNFNKDNYGYDWAIEANEKMKKYLHEKDHTWQLVKDLANPKKKVIVQVAPAVRVALGEEFGLQPGTDVEGKMVTALRKLGFDQVFDTNFAADLTIMEEATELIDRVNKTLAGDTSVKLPILTSCCPAWVKFFEHNYPDMLDVPSSAKSPQQMFGAVAKGIWAKEQGLDRKDLIVVSVMPCLAKKYESSRDEFKVDGNPDVDYSISTRELAKLIKQANINLPTLEKGTMDNPLGDYTGAGVIFGRTGGVIEAATRTAYEWITNTTLENVDFVQLRGMEGIRVAEVSIPGLDEKLGSKFRIGIAHGLGAARELLDKIRAGEETLHAIEIMACKGGCVGGGGQPYHHGDFSIIKKRTEGIQAIDSNKDIRKSHENPYIKELYAKHLGKPNSHLAHELLHTKYFPKHKI